MTMINKHNFSKKFAGVGSRGITKHQSYQNIIYGVTLNLMGYKTFSGYANGTDLSFHYASVISLDLIKSIPFLTSHFDKEIRLENLISNILPWKGFNGATNAPEFFAPTDRDIKDPETFPLAECVFKKVRNLDLSKSKKSIQSLMGRNAYQVKGLKNNKGQFSEPVSFVLACTNDKAHSLKTITGKTGGTMMAIGVADLLGIPSFNTMHNDHRIRLDEMVNKLAHYLHSTASIDIFQLIEERYLSLHREGRVSGGDLISAAQNGEIDVLIHGLSCQNKMGIGFALDLKKAFPESEKINLETKSGDLSKLGTYSVAKCSTEHGVLNIINAYTQKFYSKDPNVLSFDYEAFRSILQSVASEYKTSKIGINKIGNGYANGCWLTIKHIIDTELKGFNYMIYDNYDNNLSMQNSIIPEQESDIQGSFDM